MRMVTMLKNVKFSFKITRIVKNFGWDLKSLCVVTILFNEFYSKIKSKVQKDRRSAGIVPSLPVSAERDAIKAEYMKTKPTK